MYLRFRCGLVVLDIETFRESMVSEDSICTAACEASSAAAASCSSERRCAVCGINVKITCNGVKQNNDFGPIRTPENNDSSGPTTAKSRRAQNTPA